GPEGALAYCIELRQSVIDQEQLHQQRCAAEEENIGIRQRTHRKVARRTGNAQRDGEDQAGYDRYPDQLQRQPGAVEEAWQPLDENFPGHAALLLKPRPARFSRKCMPIMAITVSPR